MIEITKENFNELLQKFINKWNEIKDIPFMELEETENVDFFEVNRHLILSSNRYRALGKIKSGLERMKRSAQLFYDEAKARATIKAALEYPNQILQKAKAELDTIEDRKRLIGIQSLVDSLSRDRRDLLDYEKRLNVIADNLRADAYATGRK